MKVFLNDGLDIREIIDEELKQDFLKLKVGDTFTETWGDETPIKYRVLCVALDDDKDTHIYAEEL